MDYPSACGHRHIPTHIFTTHTYSPCRNGGIGRRKGLKIPRWRHRIGSTPIFGTMENHQCKKAVVVFFIRSNRGQTISVTRLAYESAIADGRPYDFRHHGKPPKQKCKGGFFIHSNRGQTISVTQVLTIFHYKKSVLSCNRALYSREKCLICG